MSCRQWPPHGIQKSLTSYRAHLVILCMLVTVQLAIVLHNGEAVAAEKAAAPKPATIPQVISALRNWIMGISGGLATLFLTFGGVRYLMAGGDASEVEAAKKAMKASAIGLGIAALAPVITTVLKGIVYEGGQ
ncbi:pilin [Streptomyces sp. AJS327]|uniref:pilin n=1 Tax=Streptomyces sp. AJS327 TaxID=2545265 RepID=UPI0027E441F1|nr:pilin [Streptomyces sp. AJS327]